MRESKKREEREVRMKMTKKINTNLLFTIAKTGKAQFECFCC